MVESRGQALQRRRAVYRRRRAWAAVIAVVLLALMVFGLYAGLKTWGLLPSGQNAEESEASELSGNHSDGDLASPAGSSAAAAEPEPEPTPEPEPEPERASDPSWDPDSIHVLVNRQNPFDPVDYAPTDLVVPDVPHYGPEAAMSLRQEPAAALEELIATGRQEGMALGLVSGYRSFDYQFQIYWARHAEVGTEATDLYMSRPGYSEHQTGLAADVISIENPDCMLGECFADTPEGQWVAENAHRFGFIIRYLEDMEHITGYPYEPWHLRYVGVETATEVFELGLTLEEYWEQPAAPDYDDAEPAYP